MKVRIEALRSNISIGDLQSKYSSGLFHFTFTAEQLCTLYLAYIFRLVRTKVEQEWGDTFDLRPIYNVGAPIDQQNHKIGLEVFNRTAYWATRLEQSVWDGRPLSVLLDSFEMTRKAHPTIPPEEERPTFVQPETAAGLMAYVTAPTTKEGL